MLIPSPAFKPTTSPKLKLTGSPILIQETLTSTLWIFFLSSRHVIQTASFLLGWKSLKYFEVLWNESSDPVTQQLFFSDCLPLSSLPSPFFEPGSDAMNITLLLEEFVAINTKLILQETTFAKYTHVYIPLYLLWTRNDHQIWYIVLTVISLMTFIWNSQNVVLGSLNCRTNLEKFKHKFNEENKEKKSAKKPVAGVCSGQNWCQPRRAHNKVKWDFLQNWQ